MIIYFICFVISLLFLFRILSYGKVVDINMIMLIIIVAIGNGGFYALAGAKTLEEAILANTISYVIGIFAPVTVFHIVCSICRIRIPKLVSLGAYLLQLIIFLSLFTVGKSPLFYKTVSFTPGNPGYMTKTYGPMHTAYLVTLILFTLINLLTGLVSLERKTVVSRSNVIVVVFVNVFDVGVYIIERVTHLQVELMPVAYVIALFVLLIPLLRVYVYSVYNNHDIFLEQIKNTGYIVFDRKMKYMGCNEYATTLFPELLEWELEKKIPGSGGRFNTFLRQPLAKYENEAKNSEPSSGSYNYKDDIYGYEISNLYVSGMRSKGYIIKISRITDVVRGGTV